MEETVTALQAAWPIGTRVRLIAMVEKSARCCNIERIELWPK